MGRARIFPADECSKFQIERCCGRILKEPPFSREVVGSENREGPDHQHPDQGRELYAKLHRVTERFLDIRLGYLGAIPRDGYLRRAVQRQGAVVQLYPRSQAAQALVQVAGNIDFNTRGCRAGGGLGFFIERLVDTSSPLAEVEAC